MCGEEREQGPRGAPLFKQNGRLVDPASSRPQAGSDQAQDSSGSPWNLLEKYLKNLWARSRDHPKRNVPCFHVHVHFKTSARGSIG